jgi:hypothetical protein
VPLLAPVWEHRQQWAGFAAGHSLGDVLQLLPFTAVLAPCLVALVLASLIPACRVERGILQANLGIADDTHRSSLARDWWLWLCAWCVPCCLVYGLTASGLAPLMHRRYLFVAAFPFVIWAAHSWSALPGRALRWCTLLASLILLLAQQGSIQEWYRGRWPTAVRGEDWRGAVQWLNVQASDSAGPVYCASNLIEGARADTEEPRVREYLTFPLRSIYALKPTRDIVPLVNDPRSWRETLRRTTHSEIASAVNDRAWLVVRSSAAGLKRRLQISGLSVLEHRDFGGVQVASVRE